MFGVTMLTVVAAVALFGSSECGTGSSSTPSAPSGTTQTAGQVVHYLESQGLQPNAAAGVVGNLQQESGLNPGETGGGLAQWNPSWYSSMSAYASSQGLSPSSMAGQLEYLVYDLRTSYGGLLAKLTAASSPGEAATMFETGYELCSGVTGFMQVTPGSLCMDSNRQLYATMALGQAGGASSSQFVSLQVTGPQCAQAASGIVGAGQDPIPGFRPGRDDMGVDACGNPGDPIIAPAPSTLVEVLGDWYAGQPLLLFKFAAPLAGTYLGDEYWYVAEEISPVTATVGTQFAADQVVAHFAPSGTCIEIGWGSPTSNSRTLAVQMGDSGAANPPAGSTTVWAESFKRYFSIPWVGQSP